jgi:nitrite reductase/ring-hydroxylating ferredoxin subunit
MNEMTTLDRIQTGDELERCPMPIPFGWFCVALSEDIKPGEVQLITVFGKEWVLFRGEGEDGKVGMTDPYCPHLGANIGHDGKVVGDNIRCPFHFWEFDNQGWCKKIPYAKVMPGIARRKPILQALPVEEKYGAIFAWYHPEGAEPSYPLMDVPEMAKAEKGEGHVAIERNAWDIPTMIQEIGENGVDHVHLHYLHRRPEIPPATKPWTDGFKFGTDNMNGFIVSESWGPGTGTVRFTQEGISVTIFALSTPINREMTRMRWFFTYPDFPEGTKERAIAERLKTMSVGDDPSGSDEAGFESVDLVIWENKKYRPKPLLCDGDGQILLWREWFKQFYAEPIAE